jgi:hypothetical protein
MKTVLQFSLSVCFLGAAIANTKIKSKNIESSYVEAKKSFAAQDAKVSKQANVLVIKLNNFKVSEDNISPLPESVVLLEKLRNLVTSVNPEKVMIESTAANTKRKAELIAEYMISSQAINKGNLEIVDRSLDRSLASMKKGRRSRVTMFIAE